MAYDKLQKKERLYLSGMLNWDYDETNEEILSVIDGETAEEHAFTRKKLFVRSLERLHWKDILGLWGIDECKKIYQSDIRRMLRSDMLRMKYDFIFGLLRKENVSAPEWGSEYCKAMQRAFLPDRRYGGQQSIL